MCGVGRLNDQSKELPPGWSWERVTEQDAMARRRQLLGVLHAGHALYAIRRGLEVIARDLSSEEVLVADQDRAQGYFVIELARRSDQPLDANNPRWRKIEPTLRRGTPLT